MISYLREQPRTQALADALRGTSATGAGTQMQPRPTSVSSVSQPAPMPDYNQYGSGQTGAGADVGKMLKKGWDAYGGDILEMFGGGTTGADIEKAASKYGPEIAKMGGNVTGGSGWMDGIKGMFGSGGSSVGGGQGALPGYLGPIMEASKGFGRMIGEGENGFFSKLGGSDGKLGMSLYEDLFDSIKGWF